MSKSTTTHRAALKALDSLLKVTLDLESRLASLAESGVFEADDDEGAGMAAMLDHAAHVMGRSDRVLKDTAALSPAGEPAPVKGKAYRVKCVSDQTIEVVADGVEDAVHRAMCGEGNLVDTDTHDFVVTRLRKRA